MYLVININICVLRNDSLCVSRNDSLYVSRNDSLCVSCNDTHNLIQMARLGEVCTSKFVHVSYNLI